MVLHSRTVSNTAPAASPAAPVARPMAKPTPRPGQILKSGNTPAQLCFFFKRG
jgi:hypothetical protein